MFGMPATGEYDLRFQLLGIPVRVTPWFWIFAVLLHGAIEPIHDVVVWVVCVFLSILIHELGHALMARAFGCWPAIALHGGYGICDSQAERQTPWQRLAVLIAGPGAGLLAFGLLFGMMQGLRPSLAPTGTLFVNYLLTINLVWSLFNLLPIIPLDGGQIAAVVLTMFSRRSGARWAHVISLLGAGLLAILAFVWSNYWMALVLGYFAVINYQALQMLYEYSRSGDDSERWRG